jgi:hypothetical protein
VRWKIFPYRKFSAIFFQKIFRFLKSSLDISFFNLFLVALDLNEIAVTVDIAEYRNKEKLWSRDVIWRAAENLSPLTWWKGYCRTRHLSTVAMRILSIPATAAPCERN